MDEKKIRTDESWILIVKISIAEVLWWKCSMDIFGDTAATLNVIVSNSYYEMVGGRQISVYKGP